MTQQLEHRLFHLQVNHFTFDKTLVSWCLLASHAGTREELDRGQRHGETWRNWSWLKLYFLPLKKLQSGVHWGQALCISGGPRVPMNNLVSLCHLLDGVVIEKVDLHGNVALEFLLLQRSSERGELLLYTTLMYSCCNCYIQHQLIVVEYSTNIQH